MSGTLIVVGLGGSTEELLGAARSLGGPVAALVVGAGAVGADRVLVAGDPSLTPYAAERWLPVVESAVKTVAPELVLLPHTLDARELGPRLAFRIGAGMVTDCVGLRREGSDLVFVKPVYGGSVLAEYTVAGAPAVATLRSRAFAAAASDGAPPGAVEQLSVAATSETRVRLVERVASAGGSGPGLKDAKVVVSGGRGLGGPESWHLVEELAAALGAAVGASRAVTDAGWVPPALQVGLTGTTVNPDLYVAVGISGAVQHMAGCAGARSLVAINRDPDANVFKHARFGVVGDAKEVLPALTARIKELRG